MTPIRIAAPKFIDGPITPIRPTVPSPSLLRAPRKTIGVRNVEDDDVEADMSFVPRPRLFPEVPRQEADEADEEEVEVEMAVEVEEQVEVAPAPEVPVINEREVELAEKEQWRVEREERRRIKERISWIMAVKENGDPRLLEEAKQLKESLRELRKLRRAVRAMAEEKPIVVSASVLRVWVEE
jgi:hypothetical protein